jgi:uncharacterized protein YcfL
MKNGFIFAILSVAIFSGCSSHKAIAMNEYNPTETAKLSGATVAVTPQMIKEVQKRRAKFLKSHIIE